MQEMCWGALCLPLVLLSDGTCVERGSFLFSRAFLMCIVLCAASVLAFICIGSIKYYYIIYSLEQEDDVWQLVL